MESQRCHVDNIILFKHLRRGIYAILFNLRLVCPTIHKNCIIYIFYLWKLGLFNTVKPNRTEPNRNRQYGLVLVYTI